MSTLTLECHILSQEASASVAYSGGKPSQLLDLVSQVDRNSLLRESVFWSSK